MNIKIPIAVVLSGGRSALAYGGKQFMIPNCLMAGEWSHVALIMNSNQQTMELYLNGELILQK